MKKKPKHKKAAKLDYSQPHVEPVAYWPKPGETVKIVKSSVFWAPGKFGVVLYPLNGGFAVKVTYKDTFAGETSAKEHIIWAETVEPYIEPKKP